MVPMGELWTRQPRQVQCTLSTRLDYRRGSADNAFKCPLMAAVQSVAFVLSLARSPLDRLLLILLAPPDSRPIGRWNGRNQEKRMRVINQHDSSARRLIGGSCSCTLALKWGRGNLLLSNSGPVIRLAVNDLIMSY